MVNIKRSIIYGLCTAFLSFGIISTFLPATAYAGPADPCTGAGACNEFVENYINPFIVLFSALVGIVAVISIVSAGIQYSSSSADPGVISKAKNRMFQTVIGLFAYVFLLAFLNYLVPGGILP